jgi:tRNA pseudouridine55 synthase
VKSPERSGLVIVDKPAGRTSHDVVARIRALAGTRRVGHAGTLDPMATGVLVLGVGQATRLLTYLVGADKTYLATIRLGVRTLTDDAEGSVATRRDASALPVSRVCDFRCARRDRAVPSAVSAVKVGGRRAGVARARRGAPPGTGAPPGPHARADRTLSPSISTSSALVRMQCAPRAPARP